MNRLLLSVIFIMTAAVVAGLMAFEVTVNRTDDLDEALLEVQWVHGPLVDADEPKDELKGNWMPLAPAGAMITVREATAEPDDETFELSFATYAYENSSLFACLGRDSSPCFGVAHDEPNGWRRIGWYDRPGGKIMAQWEKAARDYLSFAVQIRQDAGELVAQVNGREVGRIAADYPAGPVRFHIGHSPMRLDRISLVIHGLEFSGRAPSGATPYLASLLAALAVIFLFVAEYVIWHKAGVGDAGAWIALGYASALLVYVSVEHPLAHAPWLALAAVMVCTRGLGLMFFPELLGETFAGDSRLLLRFWPHGDLEWVLALAPVAFGLFARPSLFTRPMQAAGLASPTEQALLLLVILAAFLLLTPVLLAALTGARPALARRGAYLALWPLAALALAYDLAPADQARFPAWLPVLAAGVSLLVGFFLAAAQHKRTGKRWAVVAVLLLLVTAETAARELSPWPEQIYYHGDRFSWDVRAHSDLLGREAEETPVSVVLSPDQPQPGHAVLCLGACAVRDSGLIMGDVFPTLLPGLLADLKAQVINAAVPKYNSWQNLIYLKTRLTEKYKPDIVILYLGNRERVGAQARALWQKLTALPEPRTPQAVWRAAIEGPAWLPSLLQHSGLVRRHWLAEQRRRAEQYRREQSALAPADQAQNVLPPTNRDVLAQFAALGAELGFTPLFVPVCTTAGEFADPYHAELMRSVAAEHNLPFVDLRAQVKVHDSTFLNPNYLSPKGHQMAAKALAAVIEALLNPQPESP